MRRFTYGECHRGVQAFEGGTWLDKAQLLVYEVSQDQTLTCLFLFWMRPDVIWDSQGFFNMFGSYDDNGEGVDKKLCLHFYSRFKFVVELAPLLQAAKDAGEAARVVTVLGAAKGNRADLKYVPQQYSVNISDLIVTG